MVQDGLPWWHNIHDMRTMDNEKGGGEGGGNTIDSIRPSIFPTAHRFSLFSLFHLSHCFFVPPLPPSPSSFLPSFHPSILPSFVCYRHLLFLQKSQLFVSSPTLASFLLKPSQSILVVPVLLPSFWIRPHNPTPIITIACVCLPPSTIHPIYPSRSSFQPSKTGLTDWLH